jgi:uncharacterized membrane protein
MSQSKFSVRSLVISGVLGALTIVLGITHIGLIPWFGGASLTFMHVPVILAGVLAGPVAGMAVGLIFGVFSLIQAAIGPLGPFDPFFVNPLVSVLPRMLIGLVSGLLYTAVAGKKENAARVSVGTGVAALAGSLTNTLLVLSALKLFASGPSVANFTWQLIGLTALVNGLPEAGLAVALSLAVVLAYKGIAGAGSKAKLAASEDERE